MPIITTVGVTMTMAFSDLPDAERMRYRLAIDAAGGMVEMYNGEFVTVAVPNPVEPFFQAMRATGLEHEDRGWFFPLGTDGNGLAETMKHDGKYPGSKGFWRFVKFRPVA